MITRKMAVDEIEHFLHARRNYYAHEIADGVVSRIDEAYAQIGRLTKERDKLKELNSALCAKSNSQVIHNARLAEENEALRAKIAEMEKQEPVGTLHDDGCFVWREAAPHQSNYAGWKMALYALPGAQPAQGKLDGWLRAIDEALVVTHLGVADESDTYEQAREKLNNLIGWHIDVATDPAVNGGWKLVPIEPTHEMLTAAWGIDACDIDGTYKAMLAAAPNERSEYPEAKP